MKEYYVNTYIIDDEWKQANPEKFHSEDCMDCFTEDMVNFLYQQGYRIKQIVRTGGNFCTILYTSE